MNETAYPLAAYVFGNLPAGDRPNHGAHVRQRAEEGELFKHKVPSSAEEIDQSHHGRKLREIKREKEIRIGQGLGISPPKERGQGR